MIIMIIQLSTVAVEANKVGRCLAIKINKLCIDCSIRVVTVIHTY